MEEQSSSRMEEESWLNQESSHSTGEVDSKDEESTAEELKPSNWGMSLTGDDDAEELVNESKDEEVDPKTDLGAEQEIWWSLEEYRAYSLE